MSIDFEDQDLALIRRALTERAGALYDRAATARDEQTAKSLREMAARCDALSHKFR